MLPLLVVSLVFGQGYPNVTCENAHCSSCDNNPKECTKCISDFFKQGTDCVHKNQVNCWTFFVGECVGCMPGFKFDPETKTCPEEGIDYCIKYNAQGKCAECDGDFAYLEGDTCVNYFEQDKHCKEKNFDQSCSTCEEGWELDENGTCTITAPFCSTPTQDGKCLKCALGYSDKDGVKTCVKMLVDYCAVTEGDKCTKCLDGYWLKNGECISYKQECETNCELCEEGNRCLVCKEGYFMKKDVVACGKCDIEHCLECYDNENEAKCKTCESGFGAKDGKCIRCAEHCLNCWADGKCGSNHCEEGYFYNQTDETCAKCADISKCENTTDWYQCRLCNMRCGLSSINGKEKTCHVFPTNCLEWNENDECTKCNEAPLFVVDENDKTSCKKRVNHCLIVEQVGETDEYKCVYCDSGYFLTKDFTCEKCSDACMICAGTADTCTYPKPTYCGANCKSCKDTKTCALCKSEVEFDLVNGTCVPSHCISSSAGNCTMCQENLGSQFGFWGKMDYYPQEDGTCVFPEPGSDSSASKLVGFLGLIMLALV